MAKTKSNNNFYIVLIVIFSVVILGLGALMVIGIANKGFGFSVENVSENLAFEEEYSLEKFTSIDAKIKAGKITVHSTQDDMARVKFYADKTSAAYVLNDGDVLKIEDKNDECHFICLNFRGVNVEVYLPDSYNGAIRIDVDAGRIETGDFRSASLDIYDDMGDVKLGVAKDIRAELDMGKLSLADCLGRLNIDNDMGDVEIRELHLIDNSEIKLDMGSLKIESVGDVRVDAEVDLGNKDVTGGNHKSDIVLKVRNSMGDITIH